MTALLTSWNSWSMRRKVPYQPPVSADRDAGERERFYVLLRKWTAEQGALVDELNAELVRAGFPPRPFSWSQLPPEAQDAIERMQNDSSVPTREPAAFQGICTAVREAMSEAADIFALSLATSRALNTM